MTFGNSVRYDTLDPSKSEERPISLCKGNILLFTGKEVPVRRYASFVAILEKRFGKVPESNEASVLLGHSVGTLRAVIGARSCKDIVPLIVSMDGSDLSDEGLDLRSRQDEQNRTLSQQCLAALDPGHPRPISRNFLLYRNNKSNCSNEGPYTEVIIYDSRAGHHPYNDKKIVANIAMRISRILKKM